MEKDNYYKFILLYDISTHTAIIIYFFACVFIFIFMLINVIHLIRKNRIFYDRIFECKYINTVKKK